MAGQNSSDDEVSNSPCNRKILYVKKKNTLPFLVGDSSLFIGLGNGYPLDNLPQFCGVRSVPFDEFDNRCSGYLCRLPCSRPKCFLDETLWTKVM